MHSDTQKGAPHAEGTEGSLLAGIGMAVAAFIMNYYNKLAMHLAFPLLLFLVFGMQKDTLELWKKKLGVYKMKKLEIDEASSSSSSSSSSSAYDWTIVQNNSRMKYLGLSRFFESSAPLAPSECEMTSGTWAKGCSSSVYMEPGKEKENVPAP